MDNRNELGRFSRLYRAGVIMIIEEQVEKNGKKFILHYSDENKYILREDGKKFASALDLINTTHTYTETDEVIPPAPKPPVMEGTNAY